MVNGLEVPIEVSLHLFFLRLVVVSLGNLVGITDWLYGRAVFEPVSAAVMARTILDFGAYEGAVTWTYEVMGSLGSFWRAVCSINYLCYSSLYSGDSRSGVLLNSPLHCRGNF